MNFLVQYINDKIMFELKNEVFFIFYQSMTQFSWHDGTIKNVHVDPTMLNFYQVIVMIAVK